MEKTKRLSTKDQIMRLLRGEDMPSLHFREQLSFICDDKGKHLLSDGQSFDYERAGLLVGAKIRRRRQQMGIRQIDVAIAIDVSASYISEVEQGNIWRNFLRTALIIEVLRLDIIELFREVYQEMQ